MLLAHILMWGLGIQGYAQVNTQIIGSPITQEDRLRYQCSQQLVQLSRDHIAYGPLFFEKGVLFTSVTANNGRPLLILQTPVGIYAVQLNTTTINRVQVQLPLTPGSNKLNKIFISYFHNAEVNRRYFEFTLDKVPPGKELVDFKTARASLAPYLKPHLDHLLLEHIDSTATAIIDRRIKFKAQPNDIAACTQLARVNPVFSRYSGHQLAAMQVKVKTDNRMPASLSAPIN